jgi:hypothetical protein
MADEAVQPAKPAGLGFNALYLDTNVLVGFNWPAPALALENLLILAAWSNVALFQIHAGTTVFQARGKHLF